MMFDGFESTVCKDVGSKIPTCSPMHLSGMICMRALVQQPDRDNGQTRLAAFPHKAGCPRYKAATETVAVATAPPDLQGGHATKLLKRPHSVAAP